MGSIKNVHRIMISVLLAFSIILAGCTSTETTTTKLADGTTEASDSTSEPASDEKVTIRILTRYSGTDATTPILEAAIKDFMDTYPNITIQNDSVNEEAAYNNKLKTDIATGNVPHFFYMAGVASSVEYAKSGMLMDVTPLMEDKEFYDGFIPGMFETWNFEQYGYNGYYGIPFSIGVENFYYNKDLFAQAGIENVPETMDDLYSAIDKLNAAGIVPWGVGAKATWRAGHIHNFLLYKTVGVDKVKELGTREAKWTDPEIVETLELFKDLKERGAFEPNFEGVDYDTEKANFLSGKSAMVLNGSWFVGDVVNSDIKDKIGMFPFPYFSDKPQFKDDVTVFPQGFYLSGKMTEAEKDATFKWVKYFCGKEVQSKMVTEIERLSARSDIEVDESMLSPLFLDVQNFVATIRNPGGDSFDFDPLPSMQDRTRNSIVGMLLGNSAADAAKEIQDEIDRNTK